MEKPISPEDAAEVLRVGAKELAAEQSEARAVPFTDDESALYFGAPEETPIARRNEAILGLSRQAEELGISVVNLLSETILAENDVRHFERWSGKRLEWGPFMNCTLTAQRLRRERSDIEKEARAITEGPYIILGRSPEERDRATQEHQQYLAAREATLEKRRRKLEEEWSALGEEWKALDVLTEIIRNRHRAPSCPRVRIALECLRSSRLLYSEEELPLELKELLDDIGRKVARPKKYTRWKASEQERKVLYVWGMRTHLGRDAREKRAQGLGFHANENKGSTAWGSLERVARRYVARSRAKETPAQETEPEDEP